MSTKVLLAIPCYNPTALGWRLLANYLENLFDVAKKRGSLLFEVVVVDDGSQTWIAPPVHIQNSFVLIRLPKNLGKGGAIRAALQSSKGHYDVFAITDFDTPYSAEDLFGMSKIVCWNQVQICIGDRTHNPEYERRVGFGRRLFHRAGRLVVRALVAGGISDTQCGLKAYSYQFAKMIAEKSRIDGFLFDLEWLYIALKHGLTVARWPVALSASHTSASWVSRRFFKCLRELVTLVEGILFLRYRSEKMLVWANLARRSLLEIGFHDAKSRAERSQEN